MVTERPIDICLFNESEVSEQLEKIGLDKATGPDDRTKYYNKESHVEEEQDGADIQMTRRYTRVPRQQTNVPLLETMGMIIRGEVATNRLP